MDFLRLLESIRTPFLNTLFSYITYIGDESLFLGIAVALFWCIDKKTGYYSLTTGFIGIITNQFLKLTFRIARPWVLDENFTIVESARAGAGGYSFPSGHTQNVTDTFGCIANRYRKKSVVIPSIIIILLTAFSRMYLGVHTPLDVGVSLIWGTVIVLAVYPLFDKFYGSEKKMNIILSVMSLLALIYTLYVQFHSWPDGMDVSNYNEGLKSGYMLLGASLALILSYNFDNRVLHFETKAPLPAQIIKLGLGFALMLGIKAALKSPLYALTGGSYAADALRYFIVVVFVGCIWPLTFPILTKLFSRKKTEEQS